MVRNVNRRDVLKGTGAAGLAAMAGCVDDGGTGGRTIRLGLLMGVTGGLEELGPPIRDASIAAVDQINDGDTSWEVETAFEDTATDPDDGVLGAEALQDAGFQMFVGALASDVSMPVAQSISIPDQIVQMSPASTTPDYTDLEGDWTFRTAASDAIQGVIVAELAHDREGAETAAWIGRDDPYGRGLGGVFAREFENLGGEITAEVPIDPAGDRFVSQLEEALGDDPDALFIVAFPEEAVQIFTDFFGNFDPGNHTVLVPDGLRSSDLPGDVGEDFSDFIGTQPTSDPELESGVETFSGLSMIPMPRSRGKRMTPLRSSVSHEPGPVRRIQRRSATASGRSQIQVARE